jgi:hypothetical protein
LSCCGRTKPDSENPVLSDSGSINPRTLADQLDISLAELARLVGESPSTLAAEPLGEKGHEAYDRHIAARDDDLAASRGLSDQTGQVCRRVVDRKLGHAISPWLDV